MLNPLWDYRPAVPGLPTRGGDGMVDAVPLPSTAASADLILDKELVAAEG